MNQQQVFKHLRYPSSKYSQNKNVSPRIILIIALVSMYKKQVVIENPNGQYHTMLESFPASRPAVQLVDKSMGCTIKPVNKYPIISDQNKIPEINRIFTHIRLHIYFHNANPTYTSAAPITTASIIRCLATSLSESIYADIGRLFESIIPSINVIVIVILNTLPISIRF
ncbi:hypothetical protein CHU_0732 [Cytophaga hutchinsonii ATCC 33406]|uniref:Uncharacterized protein n=1 Tax=Cytophaga hutchinsonii (strain ATCC 33406 / DSM 1761 / CIP 103989 / NBRC 15051 / NCIMB 9469 / D465) TaxID=269798 RepID=A0A6N4SP16_CYTH3|nr:hypothetical protein CHU_0732 [Cytophaga hutchinsonii ATCC 33406]